MKKYNVVMVLMVISFILFSGCARNKSDMNGVDIANEPHVTDAVNEESVTIEVQPVSDEENFIEPISMYTTENVNVRAGEGESYDVIDVLERGTLIEILSYENEWCLVNYKGEMVFVASEYLSSEKPMERKRIVIDAGHQSRGNSEKEPNGPGSSIMKAKVSSGTKGVSTGVYEYELNLLVTLQLRDELEKRGYDVILVRDSHDVDISNVERAMVANDHNADCFIRIHANGDNNQTVEGILTICQTADNPYNAKIYPESYRLSKEVLEGLLKYTGAKEKGIWETDTMTGINWCEVPSTIVEMGYMSNPKEDQLLNTESYQEKIVQGVADGLDRYFADDSQ